MFPLHEPDGLHRIALFLPSCSLLGLYTFRFCLTACLFCLPAYFLRSTGGILALPFFSPRFIGTPLFRRGGFCQSRLTALVCGKELLRVDQFLAMQLLYCLCSMLPIPVILWYTHKNYPWIDHHAKPDYSAVAQKNSVLMHQLSGVIFNNTDMVLLSYFCNFQLVSVYSIYNMFFVQIVFVMNLFLNSISFRMGQIFHTDRERFLGLFDLCETLYLVFVAFCYTMTAAFLLPVIRIYTSGIQDTNYIDAFLLLLFALKAVLESGKGIYHQVVQYEGAFQQTRWHALAEMTINLAITLFGIQFFGIYGCLFGTLAALLCRLVLIFRYTYRNILHQSMARPALKWGCYLGLMALILRIVGIQSRPELSLPGVIGVALLHMIWIGAAFAGAAFLFDHDLLRKLRTLRSSIRS